VNKAETIEALKDAIAERENIIKYRLGPQEQIDRCKAEIMKIEKMLEKYGVHSPYKH
jgi:hypothetical protein